MAANPTRPAMCVVVRAGRTPSTRPRIRPPTTAPGMLPRPPSIMTAMPFHEGKAPHGRADAEERADEAARHRGETTTQEHGHRRDAIDVHSLQGGAFPLLGDGEHRLSGSRQLDEEEKAHEQPEADEDDDESLPRDGDSQDMEDPVKGLESSGDCRRRWRARRSEGSE